MFNYKMKPCERCWVDIPCVWKKKYCNQCRQIVDDELRKQREEKKRKTCIKCWKPISNITWQKKYCSQCRWIMDRELRRKKISASK